MTIGEAKARMFEELEKGLAAKRAGNDKDASFHAGLAAVYWEKAEQLEAVQ